MTGSKRRHSLGTPNPALARSSADLFSASARFFSSIRSSESESLRKIISAIEPYDILGLGKDWNPRCTDRVVFRLDKELGERRTSLTFDGELSRECIESLERCCEEALKGGRPVDLILRDITGVDEAGQALLRRLAARGVCLFANGVYVSYLLDSIRAKVSADKNGLELRLRRDQT